jgi:hypothetical protein
LGVIASRATVAAAMRKAGVRVQPALVGNFATFVGE